MKRSLQDLAALAARLGVGGIFFANGWQKLEAGLTLTGVQFAELNAPLPGVWAAATMLIELVGGTLLIAGLAVPVLGLLLFGEALAVFVLTAANTGVPLTGGDIRLVVAIGAACVLLSVIGAGRVSVDHMVVIKRRVAEEADETTADAEADPMIAILRDRDGTPAPLEAGPGGDRRHDDRHRDDRRRDDKPRDEKPSADEAPPTRGSGAGPATAKATGGGATGPRSRRAKRSGDETTAEPER